MAARPIQSITIVGGGTSGWLSAVFLAHVMESSLHDGSLKITLIESPTIPIIGVGEATSPALPHLFQLIGLNEREFIKEANVAFKLSGYFDGWNVFKDGTPRSWINPFMAAHTITGRSPGYYYLKYGRGPDSDGASFSSAISPCPEMIERMRGPRLPRGADYETVLMYAYHMDALVLAKQLRDLGKAVGVKHILDDVTRVNLDEHGFVASLDLKKHGAHPVEFVIDATGFASVIIGKTLNEPFEPFGKYLPNDRAAVVQIPHVDPTTIEPVSRATALGNGWIFNVPLFNRVGAGYVFSSQFTSDDEAIAELKAYLGPRIAGREPRIIRMRIGKSRRSWVKNCVAIGLSSGFAEPLEATAIHSVDVALRWLYAHFPDAEFSPALSQAYNRLVDDFYAEVIDYIVLHFYLNNRNDTEYWVTAREGRAIPDSLAGNLELWKHKMPRPTDLRSEHFFNSESYLAALMGKGFYDFVTPELPGVREVDWRQFMASRQTQSRQFLAQLPGHHALLCQIRGEASPATENPPLGFNIKLS
jgi:tryptophan halogenase